MNAWELLQQTFSKVNIAAKETAGQASADQPAAVDPALQAQLQAKDAEIATLKAANEAAAAVSVLNAAAEAAKVTLAANIARVDAAVSTFRMVPSTAAIFKDLAAKHPEGFDLAMKGIEAGPAIVALAGGTNAADIVEANAAAAGADDAMSRLNVLATEYMKSHAGVKHHEAFALVCRDNKELAAAAYQQSQS